MMKRALLTVPIAVLAVAGTALALPSLHDYNGAVKSDQGGSAVAFSIDKSTGHKRVFNIDASGLDYTCDGGSPGQTPGVAFEGIFRVRKDHTFGGKTDVTILATDPPGRFEGKLKPGGKATGVLRVHGELDPEGQPSVKCDTGLQAWKADKD